MSMQTEIREQNYPYPMRLDARRGSLRNKWLASCSLLLITMIAVSGVQALGPAWARAVFEPLALGGFKAQATLLAVFIFVVVIHEVGHLATAVFMKFRVLAMSVGPLRIARLHRKWTVTLSAKGLFAASISAIPLTDKFWRGRMLAVIAAGPTTTLFSGIAAAWLLLFLPDGSWSRTALSSVAELSLFTFVLGLIPNGTWARVRNDSQLLRCVLRDANEAAEIRLYHRILQLRSSGVRPKDYPDDLIHKLAASQGRPDMSLVFADTITQCAIDRGVIGIADAWDRRAMELRRLCDTRLQQFAIAQSGCFDILFRNDLASAIGKFAEVQIPALSPPWLRHRVRAAERLTAGRISEALAEISPSVVPLAGATALLCFRANVIKQIEEQSLSRRG
jgi:hypothetical protein